MSNWRFLLMSTTAGMLWLGGLGCGESPTDDSQAAPGEVVTKDIGQGKLEGKTYSHDYFQLKITFPESWHVASQEESDELTEVGTDMAYGESGKDDPVVKAAQARTLNLVAAFQHPPGTPVPRNANLIFVAERVSHLPGIKQGEDYLKLMKMSMSNTNMRASYQSIETNHRLGSLPAACLPMQLHVGLQSIQQRAFATLVDDYVLLAIASYTTDEEWQELNSILESMEAGK